MRLKATSNADQVFAKLDAWTAGVQSAAVPRTLNKLADQAKTVGLRKINEIYRIGPRQFDRYTEVRLARQGALEATISVKGRGLPLNLFKPRQIRGKGGGVSVEVKGRRFLIPHAFIARLKSGRVGVFARGAYGGKGQGFNATGKAFGRFRFGRKRLPINELFTFGPPEAFSNEDVTEAMTDRVAEQAQKVFAQEVRFASR